MEITAPLGSYLTPSFEHATVGDAMRPRVMTCDPDTPLVTVAQHMAAEHVHSIVLLGATESATRQPWAIVTDRDLLRCASRRGRALDARRRGHPRLGPRLIGPTSTSRSTTPRTAR